MTHNELISGSLLFVPIAMYTCNLNAQRFIITSAHYHVYYLQP
jgi:hypothetical protein